PPASATPARQGEQPLVADRVVLQRQLPQQRERLRGRQRPNALGADLAPHQVQRAQALQVRRSRQRLRPVVRDGQVVPQVEFAQGRRGRRRRQHLQGLVAQATLPPSEAAVSQE